jgi:hypothetical protein
MVILRVVRRVIAKSLRVLLGLGKPPRRWTTQISLGSLWEARIRIRIPISHQSRRWLSKHLFSLVMWHYDIWLRCVVLISSWRFTGLTFICISWAPCYHLASDSLFFPLHRWQQTNWTKQPYIHSLHMYAPRQKSSLDKRHGRRRK